jgi:hypothetical protein
MCQAKRPPLDVSVLSSLSGKSIGSPMMVLVSSPQTGDVEVMKLLAILSFQPLGALPVTSE